MPSVAVDIVGFVAEHQPGFVECVLVDAFGQPHHFIETASIVSSEALGPASPYPRAAAIACEVLAEWVDAQGRALVPIDSQRPWGIESAGGAVMFVGLSSQVLTG